MSVVDLKSSISNWSADFTEIPSIILNEWNSWTAVRYVDISFWVCVSFSTRWHHTRCKPWIWNWENQVKKNILPCRLSLILPLISFENVINGASIASTWFSFSRYVYSSNLFVAVTECSKCVCVCFVCDVKCVKINEIHSKNIWTHLQSQEHCTLCAPYFDD